MAQPKISSSLFYPETPPKKSRLLDCNVKPPFSTFRDHLVDFDKKLSEPIKDLATQEISVIGHGSNISDISKCSGRESPLPLKNLGNTCYENSIIQCLFNLNMFMDKFNQSIERISNQYVNQNDPRYRISNAFYNLHKCYVRSFQSFQDDEQRQQQQQQLESRLEELKLAVGERSSQFISTHQQDASEFFYHVIDSIQEYYQSLNKTNDHDNPVTQAFELELDYMMRCPKCKHRIISESEKIRTLPLALPNINEPPHVSSRDDDVSRIPTPPTSDLGLDSPDSGKGQDESCSGSSEEKENQALDDEITSSNDVPTCMNIDEHKSIPSEGSINGQNDPDSCQNNQQVQSHQQPRYTLSDALANYFEDDLLESKCSQPKCDSTSRTKKCLIRKLPQILFITLARYSYSGKKSLDEIEAPFKLSVPFLENKSPTHSPPAHSQFGDADNNYHLVAVVCHLGSSLDAGHYTSYVYNQSSASWFSCDDDSITKVRETDVRDDARRSGYCFFYAHKSSGLIEAITTSEDVQADCIAESSVVMTPESSPPPPSTSGS